MDRPRSWIYRSLALGALFLATTFGFAAYRYSSFAVWNDSPCVFHPRESDEVHPNWERTPEDSPQAPVGAFWFGAARQFVSVQDGGYRPLSKLWTFVAAFLFFDPKALPFPLLLLVGALHGAFALSLFAVARRFVRHDLTALGAVFLVLASPPLVASSWVCVAGVQVLVPLLFCLSLLCYWSVVEGRYTILSCVGLILLLLLGPWVREFFGLNALLLLLLEWQRARRPTWLMGVASLGFLHALFPTALMHWLFVPALPVQPVYQLGTLAGALANDSVRWSAAWHFLPLLPPLLWVCGGVEAAALCFDSSRRAATPQLAWFERVERRVRIMAIPCWIVLFGVFLTPSLQEFLGVVLCLGLAALAMRRDLFLGCWFLLMFVPILRVFTEHVHFLYALPPAAIILAQAAESLWLRFQDRPRMAWVRHAVASVLVLVGLDQAMNVYGAYRVNHAAYDGIDEVADWFERCVPKDAVVVTNAIHGEEIKWHSGNHIQIYWTIGAGINAPSRSVEQPADLEALLANRGPRPVYFLDVDSDYPPSKAWYHRHKYVYFMDIAKRDLGVVHVTKVRYPFFDPLRYLIPKEYQPFLGAPDLVNDFGRGLADNHPFRHQVDARYRVYEVTGSELEPRLIGPVHLEEEGVAGFNILRVGLGYHALPQADGSFDIETFRQHGYSVQFSGRSLEAVRLQIQDFRMPP